MGPCPSEMIKQHSISKTMIVQFTTMDVNNEWTYIALYVCRHSDTSSWTRHIYYDVIITIKGDSPLDCFTGCSGCQVHVTLD